MTSARRCGATARLQRLRPAVARQGDTRASWQTLAQLLSLLGGESTALTSMMVTAELADLLLRKSEPGATLLLSSIRTAIGNAAGLTDYTLTVPSADVTNTANQLPTLGTVTYS